jgi:glycosyltransferase involved in cell wall biosynthesis
MATTKVFRKMISGGDILFVEILKRWEKRRYGCEIEVVVDPLSYELWTRSGVAVRLYYRLPSLILERFASLSLVPLIYSLRILYLLSRLKRINTPNIIYTSSDYLSDIIPATLLKFLRSKKGVRVKWFARIYHVIPSPIYRQGNFLLNLLSFSGQRLSFWIIRNFADLTITLAGTYSELKSLGFPENRLEICNGGADLNIINEAPPSKQHYDAVSICRIHPTKGIFDLIEIWARVAEKIPSARLAIIGGGAADLVASFMYVITSKGLDKNVHYLGFISSKEELYGILKNSKIYLDAEHEDGWSLAICEALACGVPVISYKLRMFDKAFKKGVVLVPLRDKSKFADAIIDLLQNEEKRLQLAAEALHEAEKLSWESVADELFGIIKRRSQRTS